MPGSASSTEDQDLMEGVDWVIAAVDSTSCILRWLALDEDSAAEDTSSTRFVAPGNVPKKWHDLTQCYLQIHCPSALKSVVLPDLQDDEFGQCADLVRLFSRLSQPSFLLRGFAINSFTATLSNILNFTGSLPSFAISLRWDILFLDHNRVYLVRFTPADESASGLLAEPQLLLTSTYDWLRELIPEDYSIELWLLDQEGSDLTLKTNQHGLRYRHTRPHIEGLRNILLDSRTSHQGLLDIDTYPDLCAKFVVLWSAFGTRPNKATVKFNLLKSPEALEQLSNSFITMVAPDWRFQSKMFPPIFKHYTVEPIFLENSRPAKKGPPASGQKLVSAESSAGRNIVGTDAEKVVFEKLERCGHANHPLLCFRGVKLDTAIINYLNASFGSMVEEPFRNKKEGADGDNFECDFVCLHPKAGIVFIEVKAACNSWGSQRKKAERSLNHAVNFLKKMCKILKMDWSDGAVKKVLVLANEDRNSLMSDDRKKSDYGKLTKAGIEVFCNQDSLNKLFTSRACGGDDDYRELYEQLSPIVACIHRLGTDDEHRQAAAIKQESHRVSQHQICDEKPKGSKLLRTGSGRKVALSKKDIFNSRSSEVLKSYLRIHLLTPAQMKVWNSGHHQLIVGPPGTGKTVLLKGMIADRIVNQKKPVIVYARAAAIDMYEAYGRHLNCGDLLTCKDVTKIYKNFPNTYKRLRKVKRPKCEDKEFIYVDLWADAMDNNATRKKPRLEHDAEFKEVKRYQSEFDAIVKDSAEVNDGSKDVILVDDILPSRNDWSKLPSTYVLEEKRDLFFLVSCIRQEKFDSLWVACTLDQREQTYVPKGIGALDDNKKSKLHTVLRNTECVYKYYSQKITDSVLGHRFSGVEPKQFTLKCVFDRWQDPVANTVYNEIQRMLEMTVGRLKGQDDLTIGDMAVIVNFPPESSFDDSDHSILILRQHFEAKGIRSESIAGQYKLQSTRSKSKSIEPVLAVDTVQQSYSSEWPVVFIVRQQHTDSATRDDSSIPANRSKQMFGYSRCITCLIDIGLVDIGYGGMDVDESDKEAPLPIWGRQDSLLHDSNSTPESSQGTEKPNFSSPKR